jgi:hypothetical protein
MSAFSQTKIGAAALKARVQDTTSSSINLSTTRQNT